MALAPVFLYFNGETKSQLHRSLKGEKDLDWIENAIPVLRSRMQDEIIHRLELSEKALRNFPDNLYTRMLHAAPSGIVQMMLGAAPVIK